MVETACFIRVQMHGVTVSCHQPVCKMPVRVLSRFLLPRRLIYNLENEKELLASMDIDHPVHNSTNNTVIESEVSEEVSDENTEPSKKIQTNRDLQTCQPRKSTKLQRRQRRLNNTKDNTKCAAQVFERKM